MNPRHEAILLRFPEYREKIQDRSEKNHDFKSLCSDYEQCIEMLESLTCKPGQIQSKLEVYLEIKFELEQEVLKYLFE